MGVRRKKGKNIDTTLKKKKIKLMGDRKKAQGRQTEEPLRKTQRVDRP